MNRFPLPLVLVDLGESYKVRERFVYESKQAGQIEVPAGFPTDLASFRVLGLAARGKVDAPAVVHDWLYANGSCSRWQADWIFAEAMEANGVPDWRKWLYFSAVRIGARKAWQQHRSGKTAGARFVRLQSSSNLTSVFNQP